MTPKPFRITAKDYEATKLLVDAGWSLDNELADLHRAHCHMTKPILGVSNSLTNTGSIILEERWAENRDKHMAEAHAEWQRAAAEYEGEQV